MPRFGIGKIAFVVLALLVSVWGAPGRAEALIERPAPLAKPTTLRLGLFKGAYTVAFEDVPALLQGTNLNLEIASFVRYADARTAITSGALDVATISPGDLLVAMTQGVTNLVGLTGVATSKRFFVVRNGIKVEDWSDLIGKRVGIAPGSSSWFQFTAKLQDVGLPYNKLTTANIQGAGSNFLIALKQGDIDVALTWEPFESEPIVDGYGYWPVALDYSDSKAVGDDTGMIAATRSALTSQPDAVKLLLWAFLKSEEQLRNDPARYNEVIQKYTGASAPVAERIAAKIKLGGSVDAAQLERYAKTFYALGALPRDVSADIPKQFDPTLKKELIK
jgi:sulfonate transport system substrate-binding protein